MSQKSIIQKEFSKAEKFQILIKTDDISRKFEVKCLIKQQSMNQIVNLFKVLGSYTQNLEFKVDNLLRKQQIEFFNSYKTHMKNIEEIVDKLKKTINAQQKRINEYQNEGKLSELIKKTNKLNKQLLSMYRKLQQKDRLIEDYRIKQKIWQKQQKRQMEKIKDLMRQNEVSRNIKNVFTTEIEEVDIQKSMRKQKFNKSTMGSIPQLINTPKIQIKNTTQQQMNQLFLKKKYQKQIAKLNKKYQQLLNSNVIAVNQQNQLQTFFLNCVETIKRQIQIRNNSNYCSYQSFKKQDKLKVLINFVCDERIVQLVYERLFEKNRVNNNILLKSNGDIYGQQRQIKNNLSVSSHKQQYFLPQLKTGRRKEELRKKKHIYHSKSNYIQI